MKPDLPEPNIEPKRKTYIHMRNIAQQHSQTIVPPPNHPFFWTSTANSFHKKCHEQLQPPSKKGIWSWRFGDINVGSGQLGRPWFKASCRWHPSRICGWRLRHSVISILHLPEENGRILMAFLFLEHMIQNESSEETRSWFQQICFHVDINLE